MRIAIIGGGFSGIAALGNLTYFIKTNQLKNLTLQLFESEESLGGLAYGRYPLPEHLMNVPIKIINPFIDDDVYVTLKINKLVTWLNKQSPASQYDELDFCPRALYGQYLAYVAEQCTKILAQDIIFLKHRVRNVDIKMQDKSTPIYQIICEHKEYLAHGVIWATGYGDHLFNGPKGLQQLKDAHYVRNLWDKERGLAHFLKGNIQHQNILVLGSALSGMDVVVSLYEKFKMGQFKGTIYLVSRNALLHSPIVKGNEGVEISSQEAEKYDQLPLQEKISRLEKIFAELRIDPDTVSFSKTGYVLAKYLMKIIFRDPALDGHLKKKLLDLYMGNQFTDVFTTGMPQSTSEKLCDLIRHNVLEIKKAEIKAVNPVGDHLNVTLEGQGPEAKRHPIKVTVSRIINATGDTEIESKLDSVFTGVSLQTDEIDEHGHFLKLDKQNFLPKILCVGPMRALNVTKIYGLNRSTVRSIIELRPQAYETTQSLLVDMGLLASVKLYERKPVSNSMSNAKKYQTAPGHVKRIAIITSQIAGLPAALTSDMIIIPDQAPGQSSVTIPKGSNSGLFFSGKNHIDTPLATINTQVFNAHQTTFGDRTIVNAHEGKLTQPDLQNTSLMSLTPSKKLTIDMTVPVKKTVTIESIEHHLKTTFQLKKQANLFRIPGTFHSIDSHSLFVMPIVKFNQNSKPESKDQFTVNNLLQLDYYKTHKKISLYCDPVYSKFLAHWLSNQSLNNQTAPIFIYLPLEELLKGHFSEEFSIESLIRYFYEKATALFLQKNLLERLNNFVFIISGHQEIQDKDHIHYLEKCLTDINEHHQVIFLSSREDREIQLDLCGFYYIPILILDTVLKRSNKDKSLTLTGLFNQFIEYKLILPHLITPNSELFFNFVNIKLNAEYHAQQKFWLQYLIPVINGVFNPHPYDLPNNSYLDLTAHSVKTLVALAYLHRLHSIETLTLITKLIEYLCQKDFLRFDSALFTYADHIVKHVDNTPEHWPEVAQYLGALVKFHVGNRSERSHFIILVERIKDFISTRSLDKSVSRLEWVQVLYNLLGIAMMEAGQYLSALKCFLQIGNYSFLISEPRRRLSFHANLGTLYQCLNRRDDAEKEHKLVLAIHQSVIKDPNIGYTYNALAAKHVDDSNLNQAEEDYINSIKWSRHYGSRSKTARYAGWACFGLAKIACFRSDRETAVIYMNEFIKNINVIFNEWPGSYITCLKQLKESVSSLNPPKQLSKLRAVTIFLKRRSENKQQNNQQLKPMKSRL